MGIENEELEQVLELEDRGDEVSPDLLDDDDLDEEIDAGGGDGQEDGADDQAGKQDDLDPDVLRELAGEEEKPRMIPHARFNEVNESLKTEREARLRLEEELARAKGAAPAPQDKPAKEEPAGFDFEDADARLDEAMYEGDSDKAKQIRAEIRAAERAELERLADEKAEARYQARMEEQRQEQTRTEFEKAAAQAAAKYSFLDGNSPDLDEEAVGEVIALRDAYVDRGMGLAEALTKAADRVAKLHGHTETEEETDPPAKEKQRLTADQITRNLDREKQIPARDKGVGERANRIDYENLSEDEFDNLSESEKRKARGDFVG